MRKLLNMHLPSKIIRLDYLTRSIIEKHTHKIWRAPRKNKKQTRRTCEAPG